MTAYTKNVDADSGVAETTGSPFQIITDLKGSADQLRVSVQDYLDETQLGIESFTPFYAPNLPSKSFNRSYSGYEIDNSGMPDSISIGDAPAFDEDIGSVTFDPVTDPGDYDGYTYTPSFPPAPNIEAIQDPSDWDGTIDVTVPTGLVVPEPTDMSLRTIQIPIIPSLDISDFTAIAPTFDDIREVDAEFNFTEIDYTSDVLTQTNSLVQQMIAGGVGIPELIWNRIFERAGVQIDQANKQLINTINTEWASRGFSLPQGVQVAQVAEARQEASNKKAELARDNAIAYSQEEIKNLQFAIQQGIAFETLRGGWHEQEMQRSLEVAKYIVESQINLLQADIALVNAKAQVFNTEAQVYKILIDGEIAKLETQRLEIEAQGLAIQSNDSQVKLYGARIQALQLLIEEFNANVAAAGTEADVMQTKVSVYAEEIKAFVARLQGQKTEVELYAETIGAETTKMSAYEMGMKIYGFDIQAYSAKIGASSSKADAETKIEQLKLQKYDSIIKGFATESDAKAKIFSAEVSGFDSYLKGEIAQAVDAYNQTKSLIDSDRNVMGYDSEQVKINIANAQSATRAAEASAKIIIDTNKSLAEVNAGLAGSIYSAVNVGSTESASASVSGSSGHSTSYNGGDV